MNNITYILKSLTPKRVINIEKFIFTSNNKAFVI